MRKEDYADMYAIEEDFWWYAGMREITASMLDMFQTERNVRALDIGCGTGANLTWLTRYANDTNVYGIDLVETALTFCRERNLKNLTQASATDLPFADEAFDVATSFDVLVQIPDDGVDEKAIAEMYRVLKTGGLAFVRVAAYEWMRSGHDEAINSQRRYTLKEIKTKMERADFKILRATYANTFLFPLAATRRLLLKRIGLSEKGSEVKPFSPRLQWLNNLFAKTLSLEARLLKNKNRRLPFGLSAICIATKAETRP